MATDAPLEIELNDNDADPSPVELEVRGRRKTFLVKALTIQEYTDFDLGWQKLRRMGARGRPIRTTPEELATQPVLDADQKPLFELDGTTPRTEPVISDEILLERRQKTMTAEELRHYEERREAEDTWGRKFTVDSITRYITVAPGQIRANGKDLTTGADVLRAFRSDKHLLSQLLWAIQIQNNLTEDQKKIFRSLAASASSSPANDASAQTPSGPQPAATAASAEAAASARSAAATETDQTTQTESEAARSSGMPVGTS